VAKRVKRNYVNNPDFLEGLIQYRAACAEARHRGVQLPVVPNYIGACIQSIAYRLATKPNFSGYTFKEDMIMDGIENCLRYIENFDPDKSSNPFAYFTQIIWYAFLRRIAKEKKHLYTKLKSSQSMIALGETYAGGSEVVMNINIDASYIDSFIEDYEAKLDKDKEKAK
jgi:DNA-directed RNA polymerase specialized sigma24 family protein